MATGESHPVFARACPRSDRLTARHGADGHRKELLADVHGQVLHLSSSAAPSGGEGGRRA